MMFVAANQNFDASELPATIPPDKASARALLDRLGVGAGATITQACVRAGLPAERGWKAEATEPREPAATARRKTPANDNEPQAWPLLEELRRDGREADISAVRRYRLLCEAVATSPYGVDAGIGASGEDSIGIEARSLRLDGKAETKAFASLLKKGVTKLPGGEISYRETRQTAKRIASTGMRIFVPGEDGMRKKAPISMSFTEGDRLAQIDGRPILDTMRAALDVNPFDDGVTLLPLFDDAVLGGATLTWIGGTLGFRWKARSREAKIRVYHAIDIVRDQWGAIDGQMAAAERACHARVLARRAELEAQRVAYLGRAA